MKRLLGIALAAVLAAVLAGCATAPVEDPESGPSQVTDAEPVLPQLEDPNPFANYSSGMASDKEHPMAYEWQSAHESEIAKATEPDLLRGILESELLTSELLGKVKDAYATDPMAATQIAAITQLVMCQKDSKAPAMRERWVGKLLEEARRDTKNVYRTMFFLDQLRWCARAEDAGAIRRNFLFYLGRLRNRGDQEAVDLSPVRNFAQQVVRELEAK